VQIRERRGTKASVTDHVVEGGARGRRSIVNTKFRGFDNRYVVSIDIRFR